MPSSASKTGPPLGIGSILEDRYELVDELGAGGFAIVYKARQLNIDRLVAVKLLNTFHDKEEQQSYEERFIREAKLAAQVHHPNVVTIHDFGISKHRPFMVMELLEGHDLYHEITRCGPMDPKRALPLFIDCLDALGVGHNKGIVHKDLKPPNLYLHMPSSRNESLRILDFGVAHFNRDERITQSQQVLGTPKYYAPEYVRTQQVSPALDVYQMGLILVETISGRAVVDSPDPYLCLLKHCQGDLEIPRPLLNSPLAPIIMRSLALDPAQRYPDAHAFRDALEQVPIDLVPATSLQTPVIRLSDTSGAQAQPILPPPSGARSSRDLTPTPWLDSQDGATRHNIEPPTEISANLPRSVELLLNDRENLPGPSSYPELQAVQPPQSQAAMRAVQPPPTPSQLHVQTPMRASASASAPLSASQRTPRPSQLPMRAPVVRTPSSSQRFPSSLPTPAPKVQVPAPPIPTNTLQSSPNSGPFPLPTASAPPQKTAPWFLASAGIGALALLTLIMAGVALFVVFKDPPASAPPSQPAMVVPVKTPDPGKAQNLAPSAVETPPPSDKPIELPDENIHVDELENHLGTDQPTKDAKKPTKTTPQPPKNTAAHKPANHTKKTSEKPTHKTGRPSSKVRLKIKTPKTKPKKAKGGGLQMLPVPGKAP